MPTYQLTSPRTGRTYGVQAAAELPDDDIDALVNDLDFEAAREAGVQPGVDPAVLQQGPLGSFAQSIPQTFSKVGSGMIGGAGRILDKASESLSQATGLPKGGDMFQRMADYGDELSTSADLTFPTNPQNPVAGTIGSGAAQGLSLLAGGLAGKALTGSNVAMTAVPAVSGFLSGANEGIQQAERIGVQSPLAQLGTGLAFGGVEVLTERLGGIGSKAATEALTQAVRQTAGQMMKKAGKAVGSEAFEEVLAGRSQAALTRLIASEDPANPGFTTTGVKLDDLAREIVNLEAIKLEALGGAAGGTVFAGVQALANRQLPNDPTTSPNQTSSPTQPPASGQPGAPAPMGAGAPGAAAVSPLIGIAQRGGAVDVTLREDTGELTAEEVQDLETGRLGDGETETVPTPGAGAIRPQPGPSRVTVEGSIPSTAPQGAERVISTGRPNGAQVSAVIDFVEAADLEPLLLREVGTDQTRDRANNRGSSEQIASIATAPDAQLLGDSPVSSLGAPVVDDVILAGNGRAEGLLQGYRTGGAGIANYRQQIVQQAAAQGRTDVAGMRQPVMIRRVTGYVRGDRRSFVTESNPKYATLQETVAEAALLDAEVLGDLSGIEFTQSGQLTSSSLQQVATKLKAAQRGINATTGGKPDVIEGTRRVQLAALAKLATDNGVDVSELSGLLETDTGRRAIAEVTKAAPRLAALDADLGLGDVMLSALRSFSEGARAVSQGIFKNLTEWADNRGQELIRDELSPEAGQILEVMIETVRTPTKLRELFDTYLEAATNEQDQRNQAAGTNDIFGDARTNVPGTQILGRQLAGATDATPAPAERGSGQGAGAVDPTTAPGYQPPPPLEGSPLEARAKGEYEQYKAAEALHERKFRAWLEAIPANKAIIFQRSDTYSGKTFYSYAAVTKDTGGGWRVTRFDPTLEMPTGHEEFETRLKAAESLEDWQRIEKLPFQVKAGEFHSQRTPYLWLKQPGKKPRMVKFGGYMAGGVTAQVIGIDGLYSGNEWEVVSEDDLTRPTKEESEQAKAAVDREWQKREEAKAPPVPAASLDSLLQGTESTRPRNVGETARAQNADPLGELTQATRAGEAERAQQRLDLPPPLMLPSNRLGRGLAEMMPGEVPSSRFQVSGSQTQAPAAVPVALDQITVIPEDMARAEASRAANDARWRQASQSREPIRVLRRQDGSLRILDGHHRYLAARERGDTSIPAITEVSGSKSQAPSSGQLGTSNLKPATLAYAYTDAARGQSSQMLPLADVFAAAQQQNPALTPAQFQAQVMAEYEAGTVLLEGSGSRQEAESAALRIDGTPVGTAVRMMVVGNPALQNPASGATRAAMATDPGAAQNAEPSPGGLSEAEELFKRLSKDYDEEIDLKRPEFDPYQSGEKVEFAGRTWEISISSNWTFRAEDTSDDSNWWESALDEDLAFDGSEDSEGDIPDNIGDIWEKAPKDWFDPPIADADDSETWADNQPAYAVQTNDGESGWQDDDTFIDLRKAVDAYASNDYEDKRLIFYTGRQTHGKDRYGFYGKQAAYDVIAQPSFVRKLLRDFPGMTREEAASIAASRNDDNTDTFLVAQAYARHRYTDYDDRLKNAREMDEDTSRERSKARFELRQTIDSVMERWSNPTQNDEAAPVSQDGFQRQESSKSSAVVGTWPPKSGPSSPQVNPESSRAAGGTSGNPASSIEQPASSLESPAQLAANQKASGATRAAMATDPGAAQNAEPSPGGLSEAEGFLSERIIFGRGSDKAVILYHGGPKVEKWQTNDERLAQDAFAGFHLTENEKMAKRYAANSTDAKNAVVTQYYARIPKLWDARWKRGIPPSQESLYDWQTFPEEENGKYRLELFEDQYSEAAQAGYDGVISDTWYSDETGSYEANQIVVFDPKKNIFPVNPESSRAAGGTSPSLPVSESPSLESPAELAANQKANESILRALGLPTAKGTRTWGGKKIQAALAKLATDERYPATTRRMAQELAARPLDNLLLKIEADARLNWAGLYQPFNDGRGELSLNTRTMGRGELDIGISLVHEVLHHATYQALRNPKTARQKQAAKDLQALYTRAKAALAANEQFSEFDYELSNLDEFISGLWTRADFQTALAGIPADTAPTLGQRVRSVLDEIFRVLSELVTRKEVPPGSVLEASMAASLRIMEGGQPSVQGQLRNAVLTQGPGSITILRKALRAIKAYHGTPHKVDKFSTSKIGTGEGAQAYGWGLYFAQGKAVAESYRKSIKPEWQVTPIKDGFRAMVLDANLKPKTSRNFTTETEALQWAENEAAYNGGNLYTVELLADEADFLDWDKPLSEQSEKVKAALADIAKGRTTKWRAFQAKNGGPFPGVDGEQWVVIQEDKFGDYEGWGGRAYQTENEAKRNAIARNELPESKDPKGHTIIEILGSGKAASEKLASLGIPGIRYLDGGSRGAGDGTRNFAVFDENNIRITEENGQPVDGWQQPAEPDPLQNPAFRLAARVLPLHQRGEPFRVKQLGARAILTGSPLPSDVTQVLAMTENERQAVAQAAAQVGNDLQAAVKAYLDRTGQDERATWDKINAVMEGRPGALTLLTAIDPALGERSRRARNMLDDLSAAVAQTLPTGSLRDAITQNQGSWMRRGYAAFDPESGWNFDGLTKTAKAGRQIGGNDAAKILADARAYLRTQNPQNGRTLKEWNADIEADMRDLMDRDAWQSANLGGNTLRKNVSSFMRRKDIAPEIRALMGEETNPLHRFVKSAAFQSQIVARHHGQVAVRALGLQTGLFSTQRGGVYTEEIEPSENRWSGLAGVWTTPEMKAALAAGSTVNREGTDIGGWLVGTLKALGNEAKLNRVALNPDSWVVNILGNVVGLVQSGDVFAWDFARRLTDARALIKSGKARPGSMQTAAQSALVDAQRAMLGRLRGMGVLGSSITLADIEASIPRHLLQWVAEDRARNAGLGAVKGAIVGQAAGRGLGVAGRVVGGVAGGIGGAIAGAQRLQNWQQTVADYVMTGPDALARVTGWLTNYETALAAGQNGDQAAASATTKTLNTFPNYNKLPALLRQLSRLGFTGSFIAFQWEVYRNFGWNVKYAIEELSSGNAAIQARGMRRLAGIGSVAALAGGGLAALLSAAGAAGDDDERNKIWRQWFAAPWEKDAVLAFDKYDKEGVSYYNTSYLLPQMTMMELIQGASEGRDPADSASRVVNRLTEQFINGSVHLQPLLSAFANQDRFGRKITNAEGLEGAAARADEAAKVILEPGFADKITRLTYALRGAEKNGRKFSVEEEMKRLAGIRQVSRTWEELVKRRYSKFTYDYQGVRDDANKILGENLPGAPVRAVKMVNDKVIELEQQMADYERDLRRLGVPEATIKAAKKDSSLQRLNPVRVRADGRRVEAVTGR